MGGPFMKTRAQKWGNSLAIRVPKSVAQQVGLKEQDDLEIEVQDGNVVLKPQLQRVYRLEDLVKQITQKNLHGEIDTGTSVGREIW
jgi:antitoxin MazE